MGMKLLVVSWGDFERAKETKYRFGGETSVGPSTLPILQKVIKPDWTVIVLSDTIGKDFSSVETLREDVRNRVMDFLDRIGAGREVDVIIAPGIGEFTHGSFRGSAMDAYYYVLHALSEIIPTKGDLEVHFDSTHGLNYVTLLTYRALKDLLGIAAVMNTVTFYAYNSDPFVPKITKELNINTIETTMVKPTPLSEPLPGFDEYLCPYSMERAEFVRLKGSLNTLKNLRKEKKKLEAWIGSLLFGLPLLFLEEFPDIGRLESYIEELAETWGGAIAVNAEEKAVTRRLAFGSGFGTLVKLLFQARITRGLLVEEPYSIEKLYSVSDRLFRGSTLQRVRVALGKIEDKAIKYARKGAFPRDIPLRDFLGFDAANREVSPRNVLAHAGLEANVVEVSMEAWEPKRPEEEAGRHTHLKYTPVGLKKVEDIVSRALKESHHHHHH
uniref:Csm6 n=1 Tax=Thermococcus onnurineus TaxID=342948 RepID=UPI00118EA3FE|nr:Chain A, Csm6 [Thermococcus onnurineus]6O6X_B Chain B, Csm6 [Thermococcus onnurineus]